LNVRNGLVDCAGRVSDQGTNSRIGLCISKAVAHLVLILAVPRSTVLCVVHRPCLGVQSTVLTLRHDGTIRHVSSQDIRVEEVARLIWFAIRVSLVVSCLRVAIGSARSNIPDCGKQFGPHELVPVSEKLPVRRKDPQC